MRMCVRFWILRSARISKKIWIQGREMHDMKSVRNSSESMFKDMKSTASLQQDLPSKSFPGLMNFHPDFSRFNTAKQDQLNRICHCCVSQNMPSLFIFHSSHLKNSNHLYWMTIKLFAYRTINCNFDRFYWWPIWNTYVQIIYYGYTGQSVKYVYS